MDGADNTEERKEKADNPDERLEGADNSEVRMEEADNPDERMGGADNPDADFDGNVINKSKKRNKKVQTLQNPTGIIYGEPSDEVYSMSKKRMGKCIIFNHETFTCGLKKRPGTDKDVKALERFFEKYKFDVEVHNNKKVCEIDNILSQVQKEDHEDENCFVCCVLTHGGLKEKQNQEVLSADDSYYPKEKLFTPFRGDRCRSLAGKPKIFFIQACRGDKMDEGVNVFFKVFDAVKATSYSLVSEPLNLMQNLFSYSSALVVGSPLSLLHFCKIPQHADFLIAHSSVKGFYAWKALGKGSWFIQTLCETLEEKAEELDLLSILTIVCRKVAYNYESRTPDEPDMSHMKQAPSVYSTLTRWVRFNKKQNKKI